MQDDGVLRDAKNLSTEHHLSSFTDLSARKSIPARELKNSCKSLHSWGLHKKISR
jgi:hypothetical protein